MPGRHLPTVSLTLTPAPMHPAGPAGADDAAVCQHHALGGAGAVDLARAVMQACRRPSEFKFLYPLELPLKDKIAAIATQVYGAGEVRYSPAAEASLERYMQQGFGNLPVCMAKTQYSFRWVPGAQLQRLVCSRIACW